MPLSSHTSDQEYESHKTEEVETLVIGGGISGLTAAWDLQRRGQDVGLLHDGPEAGGAMRTVHKNGWTLETGPNTVVVTNTYLKEMLEELGLQDDTIEAKPAAK
ncbi:MAG: FAD-dependent oxidoreductase, partial [Cyclonatronaceae bacterium]